MEIIWLKADSTNFLLVFVPAQSIKTTCPFCPLILCTAVNKHRPLTLHMSLYVTCLHQSDEVIDCTAHHSRPLDPEINGRCHHYLKNCPSLNSATSLHSTLFSPSFVNSTLNNRLSIHIHPHPSTSIHIHLSKYPSKHPFINTSVQTSIHTSLHRPVRPNIHPYIHSLIRLSKYSFMH